MAKESSKPYQISTVPTCCMRPFGSSLDLGILMALQSWLMWSPKSLNGRPVQLYFVRLNGSPAADVHHHRVCLFWLTAEDELLIIKRFNANVRKHVIRKKKNTKKAGIQNESKRLKSQHTVHDVEISLLHVFFGLPLPLLPLGVPRKGLSCDVGGRFSKGVAYPFPFPSPNFVLCWQLL